MSTARIRILMDGNTISETPDGWEDITSSIKRIKELNSIFITTECDLIFRHDGYNYLIALYDAGFCNKADVELQEFVDATYQTFFKGIIFISSATVDRKECTITVKVEDNSFYAKINNNKSLEVFPFAARSKNNLPIDVCDFAQVPFFYLTDGSYAAIPAASYSGACYTVYNLFKYLITFMTDSEVDFDSQLFGNTGDYAGLTVTCGIVLRQYLMGGTTENDFKKNFSKISFQQLFTEVNKKVNIGIYIDYANPLPKVRIERVIDLRDQGTSFQALNIDELKERITTEDLYASVRLGSSTVSNKSFLSFFEDASFVGFKDEQFIVLGECNIDKELNLVSSFIISSNVIEDCLIQGESDYDDQLFFIFCENLGGGNFRAQQSNLEGETGVFPVFYNLKLSGRSVVNEYFSAVPLSIAQYLQNIDDTFWAQNDADQTITLGTTQVQFNTDSPLPYYDTNNLWDTALNHYTVPSDGNYAFEVGLNFLTDPFNHIDVNLRVVISRGNGAGTLILAEVDIYNAQIFHGVSTNLILSGSISAKATDLISIKTYASNFLTTFAQGTVNNCYVKCTNAPNIGGIYKTFDPNDYPVIQHQWEYPLTFNDFKSIAQNQTSQIEFSRYNEHHYSGWIDSVKFKRFKEEKAQFITYRAKSIPITSNVPIELRQVQVSGQLTDIPFSFSATDYYENPFTGSSTITKTFFFAVGQELTVTIPSTFLGNAVGNASSQTICVTKTTATTGTSTCVFVPDTSITFTIETGTNYFVSFGYDLATVGNTYPSVEPITTSPSVAGNNGTAAVVVLNPPNPIDYSFLWSTGATTQLIAAPAGNYWCDVTYIPGTFNNNTIRFYIQIPISQTGS